MYKFNIRSNIPNVHILDPLLMVHTKLQSDKTDISNVTNLKLHIHSCCILLTERPRILNLVKGMTT